MTEPSTPPKHTHGCFQKIGGKFPKMDGLYIMENPIKMRMIWGEKPLFSENIHLDLQRIEKSSTVDLVGGIFLEDIGIQVIRQQDFFCWLFRGSFSEISEMLRTILGCRAGS